MVKDKYAYRLLVRFGHLGSLSFMIGGAIVKDTLKFRNSIYVQATSFPLLL